MLLHKISIVLLLMLIVAGTVFASDFSFKNSEKEEDVIGNHRPNVSVKQVDIFSKQII